MRDGLVVLAQLHMAIGREQHRVVEARAGSGARASNSRQCLGAARRLVVRERRGSCVSACSATRCRAPVGTSQSRRRTVQARRRRRRDWPAPRRCAARLPGTSGSPPRPRSSCPACCALSAACAMAISFGSIAGRLGVRRRRDQRTRRRSDQTGRAASLDCTETYEPRGPCPERRRAGRRSCGARPITASSMARLRASRRFGAATSDRASRAIRSRT